MSADGILTSQEIDDGLTAVGGVAGLQQLRDTAAAEARSCGQKI